MTIRHFILTLLLAAYLVMWVGGVVSHAFLGGTPSGASWTAPLFLLLAGLIIVASTGRRNFPELGLVGLFGFVAEVIGIRYGVPFGAYEYTEALRPSLFGVPVVMACAWMVLFAYARSMASFPNLPWWVRAVAAGCGMTAIDLVIDPLAAGNLQYWRWHDKGLYYGIPARNFLGWLAMSLTLCGLAEGLIGRRRSPEPLTCHVGLSILLFFTVIAFAQTFMAAGAIGLTLCGAHLFTLLARRFFS